LSAAGKNIILGLNAYHADSSACLLVDGTLVAAAEEERFTRVKHWAGLPVEAVRYCLDAAGVEITDVGHIAVNRNPGANLTKKFLFVLSKRPSLASLLDRLKNEGKVGDLRTALEGALGSGEIKARVHNVEHHRAHLASSFLVSPFESAAVVSVDGFGDFVSTMWGEGTGTGIAIRGQVNFPHSLGLFYLAVTQYLGFMNYGDEYKVMGLAPYGEPEMMDEMRRLVIPKPGGRFELGLDYFRHHSEGVAMVWDDGAPTVGQVYTEALEGLLGPARKPGEPLKERHRAIAASVQAHYEDVFFHILGEVSKKTGRRELCLAGGCAMNSVANGKVFDRSGFSDLYVQSAAGDGGGAIGAAFYVYNHVLGHPRSFVMDHAYLGPSFNDDEIERSLDERASELDSAGCVSERIDDEAELCALTATRIADGSVVGWFQGRMEWGPRALGNRSIVCDPRRADMKDILNLKIKRRESFRPFAPSILREAVADWFETESDVPFMLKVFKIRESRRAQIPAVTHLNGTGRLQSVTEAANARYYRLIKEFERITGVPVVLNTSFNENEPIVCTPAEALDCFLRTKMDVLVIGDWFLERKRAGHSRE